MAEISDLSDELLVKILSFLPTKVAVSTSILSKQWEFLWMWLPNLDFHCGKGSVRDFFNKKLPLHKAPIINSLCLKFLVESLEAEASKFWVEIAVSRGLRELSISNYVFSYKEEPADVFMFLPSSLYTCNSLVTLELKSPMILVDVPRTVCLPSLKILQLRTVTYSNDESLELLLSNCPVLEDLTIERQEKDNVKVVGIIMSSLQRLSLEIEEKEEEPEDYVIVTPSLKYLKVVDNSDGVNYLIDDMPELEKADIWFFKDNVNLLESITTVKRLSLRVYINFEDEVYYGGGIDFSKLENLKLYISNQNWSKILFLLLKDSPNLQTLKIKVIDYLELSDDEKEDPPVIWNIDESSVPECLVKSLKTFKFVGSTKEKEERDVLSFIMKHACCLKSASILH